jgi:hypothetical protein
MRRVGAPGQIPEKSRMPSVKMIAPAMASGLQMSPGRRKPQNDMAAPIKPRADRSQKTLATSACARGDSEGASQKRTGNVRPPLAPEASARREKKAFPVASPCNKITMAMMVLIVWTDI